jgi:hypothetical protein
VIAKVLSCENNVQSSQMFNCGACCARAAKQSFKASSFQPPHLQSPPPRSSAIANNIYSVLPTTV